MIPGIAAPWMLPWLAAVVVPLLLALFAVRRPRSVPFAPIDFVLAAARRAHLTRAGVAWPRTLLRCLLVAAAAVAAARPFLAGADPQPQAAGSTRLVAGSASRRIVIVGAAAPGADPRDDAALAVRHALEAVIATAPRGGQGRGAAPPTLDLVPLGAVAPAAPRPRAARELVILPDGVVPGPADAARIAAAVEAGGSLLVCLGPESLDAAIRPRLDPWLEALGAGVTGIARLDDAAIELAADLAAPLDLPPAAADSAAADAFRTLPGPAVTAAAVLRPTAGDVLARTAPGGLPLVWTTRRGAGRVCLTAIPLALATRRGAGAPRDADPAWSDVAAWPVFVPLIDGLVERIAPGLLAPGPGSDRPVSPPTSPGGFRLPLAPAFLAIAILLAIADWLLAVADDGGTPRRAARVRRCGRIGLATALLGMLVAWWGGLPPAAATRTPSAPVACLIDVSPSMAGPVATSAVTAPTRLDAARDAFLGVDSGVANGGSGMLARLVRERRVTLVTAAGSVAPVVVPSGAGEPFAAALRRLTTTPAAPRESRLGDAVMRLLEQGGDTLGSAPPPAAIVVVSDGVITAGASWGQAARAAAARRVPLVAVPVRDRTAARGAGLPPGFRLTAVTAPRLCRVDDAIEILIEAEAAGGTDPVPVRLWESLPAAGPPLAESMLDWQPRGPADPPRLAGRLVVPPRALAATGSRYRSAVVVAGDGARGSAADDGAAIVTTAPLAITDAAIEVLFVESSPRFEWRFLERLLAADAAFAPQTWLVSAADGFIGPRQIPAPPRDRASWTRHDVIVLGDVPLGTVREGNVPQDNVPADPAASTAGDGSRTVASALPGLLEAASTDGVGIAWLPGPRWQEETVDSPAWLPARLGSGTALAPSIPRRLDTAGGGRAAIWLPPSHDAANRVPEVFALRGPLVLGPTARVVATAPDEARPGAAGGPPAIVIDRLGAAHVLAIFCETWRWRQADADAWRSFWRRGLARLGTPHLLARLFPATIGVEPAAITAGDAVRITITPTRATTDLAGWSLAIAPPAATHATGRPAPATVVHTIGRAEATGPGAAAVVTVPGLSAGVHELRLQPPGVAAAPAEEGGAAAASSPDGAVVSHTLVVATPPIEQPGAAAATEAFEAAALASGGMIVPLDRLDTLPQALASLLDVARVASGDGGGSAAPAATGATAATDATGSRPTVHAAERLRDRSLLLLLIAAAAAAWWPLPSRQPGSEAADAEE